MKSRENFVLPGNEVYLLSEGQFPEPAEFMQLIRSNITTEQVSLIKVFRLEPNYLVGRAEPAVPPWGGLLLLLQQKKNHF